MVIWFRFSAGDSTSLQSCSVMGSSGSGIEREALDNFLAPEFHLPQINCVMTDTAPTIPEIQAAIRNVPDFPKPGIQFKDITPLLADARLFAGSIDLLIDGFKPGDVDAVVGIDARGFIFASAAAIKLQAGLVPIRKKGKLPYRTHEQDYELEYGTATVAMHVDALKPGSRVLLIDDLLATGGTAGAAAALVQKLGGKILEVSFLIELKFLNGRERLKDFPIRSLVTY